MKLYILATALGLALTGACSDDTDETTCSSKEETARYRVTFDGTWSAATHPENIPTTPHFSGLIGATHSGNLTIWEVGGMASEGIKTMAETGAKEPLATEIDDFIGQSFAENKLSGDGIPLSPGSVELEFDISRDFPLVTLVSMIAPSPDWFVGVSRLNICNTGEWNTEIVASLVGYDAGTDSGITFEAADDATDPQEAIAKLTELPFVRNGEDQFLGTFTFVKL